MCFTWSGLLNLSSVSSPAMPFTLVASGTLWMALKFSNCVQVGQAVVSGHSMPAAFSFFAASIVSGQVTGGFAGASPALAKGSLLLKMIVVGLLNGIDSIFPSGGG